MAESVSGQEIKRRAYQFSIAVIKFIEDISKERKPYYALADQLIRSSTSIGANIIEAKSASSKKDFINYLVIALKSSNETKYWLCLFRDGLSVKPEKIRPLVKEADELSKILAKSILTLKSQLK